MTTWDAIVVGAGPGGAITAYSLARRGAGVLLVDRQAFPRWKVCGACLSAGALQALDSAGLGTLVTTEGAVPLHQLSLVSGARRASLALQGSVALSRPALDQGLVDAAVDAGVDFRSPARATLGGIVGDARTVRVERDGVVTVHDASVVIDATGLGRGLQLPADSTTGAIRKATRALGEPGPVAPDSRIGIGATLEASAYDLPRGELRMVVGRTGYVGLVRLEDGGLNIGAAVDAEALRASSPADAVAAILAEAGHALVAGDVIHGWRGTPALTRARTDVAAERLFRLGDASGYVEPFTGEGMCWALSSGLAVTDLAFAAMEAWQTDLATSWKRYHRRGLAHSRRLCRMLAWALRRPRLIRASVRILESAPRLADPLLRRAAERPRLEPAGVR